MHNVEVDFSRLFLDLLPLLLSPGAMMILLTEWRKEWIVAGGWRKEVYHPATDIVYGVVCNLGWDILSNLDYCQENTPVIMIINDETPNNYPNKLEVT